jgi:prepilin-type processing-associated H-X9-DG protein
VDESRRSWNKIIPNWLSLIIIVVFIIVMMAILLPPPSSRDYLNRAQCAAQLKQIGIGCQAWASLRNHNWPCGYDPQSTRWDDVGGVSVNSNTASLWLLVKAGLVENPSVFICPSTADEAEPELTDPEKSPLRDFRSNRGCSYSFQNVLPGPEGYVLTINASPVMAVAADANPMRRDFWSGAPGGEKGVTDEKLAEKPDFETVGWGKVEGVWELNSPNHKFKGQNVLYMDGHVDWANNPYAGQASDNIWLPQVYGAARRPDLPEPDSNSIETLRAYNCTSGYDGRSTLPAKNRTDSVLVP